MRRLYLAGPISGRADLNRPAFHTAKLWATAHRWEPLSPLDMNADHPGACPAGSPNETGTQGTHARACWIRAGLRVLLQCDGIGLLPGWDTSDGARLERHVAEACGLPVLRLPDGGAA